MNISLRVFISMLVIIPISTPNLTSESNLKLSSDESILALDNIPNDLNILSSNLKGFCLWSSFLSILS